MEKGIEKVMSKKTTVQPLSENTRKTIIIVAIIMVAIIILSVALALILKQDTNTPTTEDPGSTGSSSSTIRNGEFFYTSSDDTTYPRTASNWTKYGYKAKTSSSHDFESISTNESVLMGIVDLNDDDSDDQVTWQNEVVDDLAIELGDRASQIKNPGIHGILDKDNDVEPEDTRVYMIATKEATTASILSDSTSISSGTSVKITIWLNTEQITSGNAVVMIQKSTVSAKAENWYAYNFNVENKEGWQKLEFYIFNREASTKYIRVSVGLGNVYGGEEGLELTEDADGNQQPITAEGVLFVDDIRYDVVTANDYRDVVDNTDADTHSYKIIENEDITDDSQFLELVTEDGVKAVTFNESKQYLEDTAYSPFTDRDDFTKLVKDSENNEREASGFTIYKISHDGSKTENQIALRLATSIHTLSSLTQKDHHHISFWVRVNQVNKVAKANIYVQQKNEDGEWEDATSASSWKAITTSQEIDEDKNCGWVKYDIYLKPSGVPAEISILFVLGNDDAAKDNLYPKGDLYVTSPSYEKISYKDYNNASSGSYVKKLDLIGSSATTSVTNGSFSSLNNTGSQPASWTPAFAGDNTIYRDGNGNVTVKDITRLATDIEGSGIYTAKDGAPAPNYDDEQQNVLRIKNNVATSFGYFSNDITLSSRTVYVFSVLAKTTGDLKPYIYLLNTDTKLEREDRIVASVTAPYQKALSAETEQLFGQTPHGEEGEGWVRYYIIVVTGTESQTVRLALFNGSIDGSELQQGEIYYDGIEMKSIGTYSLNEPEEEKDENGEVIEKTEYELVWNENANYEKTFEQLLEDGDLEGLAYVEPDWDTIMKLPEKTDDNDGNGDDEKEPTEREPVDLGLLFSVISSVALVAALLVVIVIKIYRKKSNNRRAA